MALRRDTLYAGRFSTATTAHPQGAFKNRTTPTAQDGSYLEAQWLNDWDGFFGSLLNKAGLTPDGNVDAVGSSQYFTALQTIVTGQYVTAGGTANVITLADTSVTAYTDGMSLRFKVSLANTGATTLNVNGVGARTVYGSAGLACQGGELAPGLAIVVYSSALAGFVIVHCTGGNKQVPDATQSHHAISLGQVPTVVCTMTGLLINYGTDGLVTVSVNSLTLKNANNMGKTVYNVSLSATPGAIVGAVNGLDTGSWSYSTQYYLYVVYNPTTQVAALLWSLSATSPTLPSGYTYFARIGANFTRSDEYWFYAANQKKSRFQYVTPRLVFSGVQGTWSTTAPTWAAVSLVSLVPTTAVSAEIIPMANYNDLGTSYVSIAPNSGFKGVRSTLPPPITVDQLASYHGYETSLLLESTSVYVVSSAAGGAGFIHGWEDNL